MFSKCAIENPRRIAYEKARYYWNKSDQLPFLSFDIRSQFYQNCPVESWLCRRLKKESSDSSLDSSSESSLSNAKRKDPWFHSKTNDCLTYPSQRMDTESEKYMPKVNSVPESIASTLIAGIREQKRMMAEKEKQEKEKIEESKEPTRPPFYRDREIPKGENSNDDRLSSNNRLIKELVE